MANKRHALTWTSDNLIHWWIYAIRRQYEIPILWLNLAALSLMNVRTLATLRLHLWCNFIMLISHESPSLHHWPFVLGIHWSGRFVAHRVSEAVLSYFLVFLCMCTVSKPNSMLAGEFRGMTTYLRWLLIGWQHSCQPIRSHVRNIWCYCNVLTTLLVCVLVCINLFCVKMFWENARIYLHFPS